MNKQILIYSLLLLFSLSFVYGADSTNPDDYFFYDEMETAGNYTNFYTAGAYMAYDCSVSYEGSCSLNRSYANTVSPTTKINNTVFSSDEYSEAYCIAYTGRYDTLSAGNQEIGLIHNSWAVASIINGGGTDVTKQQFVDNALWWDMSPRHAINEWHNYTQCFTAGYAGSGTTTIIWLDDGINTANQSTMPRANLDSVLFQNRKASSAFWMDNLKIWNYTAYGTSPPQASVVTTTPVFNYPTPASGTINNTDITVNTTSTDGTNYYLWFGNVTPPTNLVLNNVTNGIYNSNLNTSGTYYYVSQAWSSGGGYSLNSTTQNYVFDTDTPTITIETNNYFSALNVTNQITPNLLFTNITFNDNRQLFGYIFNVSKSGVTIYNETNETLGTNNYNYVRNINTSSWDVGTYIINISLADTHTRHRWNGEIINNRNNKLSIITEENNNIELSSRDTSLIRTETTRDRIKYSFEFVDGLTRTRTFTIKSDKKITYLPNSEYLGHFIIGGVKNGNWLDFQNDKIDTGVITKITDYEYEISIPNLDYLTEFNSIGGLNTITKSYEFINGDLLTELSDIGNIELDYDDSITINISDNYLNYGRVSLEIYNNIDAEQVTLNATINGTPDSYVSSIFDISLTPIGDDIILLVSSDYTDFSRQATLTLFEDVYTQKDTDTFLISIEDLIGNSFFEIRSTTQNTILLITVLLLSMVLFFYAFIHNLENLMLLAGLILICVGMVIMVSNYPFIFGLLIFVLGVIILSLGMG